MNDVLFLPPWGLAAVVIAVAALVACAAVRALRERVIAQLRRQRATLVCRVGAITALAWILLNPTAMRARQSGAKPKLAVLIDASGSMATSDVEGKSRIEAALAALADNRAKLEGELALEVFTFDREGRPADLGALAPEAHGTASDIGSALSRAVANLPEREPQAGVLLLSDGRQTQPGADEAARLALARSAPIWSVCLGGQVARRDVWLTSAASEALAFAGAEVELAATLSQAGYDDRAFAVEVLCDGAQVARLEVAPGAAGSAPVRVKVTAPDQGERRYVFGVAPEPGEAEADNNEVSLFVRAVGAKVRVLVAEGQPHWDTKFLVQSLLRNPRVDLTAIYRLSKERQFAVVSEGGAARREEKDLFPRTADAFAAFDVVILGRLCDAFFDETTDALLGEFVGRHGGSVIFSRGKSYGGHFQALAKLEPVVWGPGVVHGVKLVPPSAESPVLELAPGGDLGALLDRLPRFDQAMETVGVKPLAAVLAGGAAEAGEAPILLASQLYGQGRVVTLNASGLWRWSFRAKTNDADEVVYDAFWSSLLRWLLAGSEFLAGHDVALRSEHRRYTDEQPLRFVIRSRGLDLAAYRPRIAIEGPGTKSEIEPRAQPGGIFTAEAGPFAPGTYAVRCVNNLGRPSELATTVEVVSGSLEARVLNADPELMARVAQTSGGRVLAPGDIGKLGAIAREHRARTQLADEKESLWDRAWLLAAALAALGAEWVMRRREGLL